MFSYIQKQPSTDVLRKRCATLLKSHFGMGDLLYICYRFSEHLFPIEHVWTAAYVY